MKLYTKTGDKGKSSLFNGDRLDKHNQHFTILGDIDELNCQIGIVLSLNPPTDVIAPLQNIQKNLMALCSFVAKAESARNQITTSNLTELEKEIDLLCAQTPPLKHLILAGGCTLGAQLHLCRSLVRRTERNLSGLNQTMPLPPTFLAYINRLSDYFFALARFINHLNKTPETPWTSD